jgi:putative ABC transport system permease protein
MGGRMSLLHLAFLNLSRRKIPTLIALCSIGISVACGGVLLRIYLLSSSRFSSLGKGGDALVGAKAGGIEMVLGALNLEGPYPDFIPAKLYFSLKQKNSVQFEDGFQSRPNFIQSVIPFVYFGRYRGYRLIGTDSTFFHRPVLGDSLSLAHGAWFGSSGEIVVGSEVAAHEKIRVGDVLSVDRWTGDQNPTSVPLLSMTVVGVLAPTDSVWDRALYGDLNQAQKVLSEVDLTGRSIWNSEILHYFLIYVSPEGLPALEALINRRTVAQVISVPGQIQRLEALTGTGRALGFWITGLIVLLAGLGVASMMSARFDAMAVQLAVLRALGYERKHIAGWLVWEGALLGGVACLLGATFDSLMFPWLRNIFGSTLPPSPLAESFVWQSWPIWAMTILATILAVLLPILRIYGQDVHSSLRGV